MKAQDILGQHTKITAYEIQKLRKGWQECVKAWETVGLQEIPGNPAVEVGYDGMVTLKYPMDKKLITGHQEFFGGLGFEGRWLSDMTSIFPSMMYCKEKLIIRVEYSFRMEGTTCVRKEIPLEPQVFKRTISEWVCIDGAEEG